MQSAHATQGSRFRWLGLLALAMGHVAAAEPVSPSAESGSQPDPRPSVEGWEELVEELQELPDKLLGRLPPSMRNDPSTCCHCLPGSADSAR